MKLVRDDRNVYASHKDSNKGLGVFNPARATKLQDAWVPEAIANQFLHPDK